MVTIFKAEPDHIENFLAMRKKTMREVCGFDEDYVFSDAFCQTSEQYFCQGNHTTVLAYKDGQIVGCASICYITLMPTFSHPSGKRAHIMNVFVEKACRRKGIARQMLELLINDAKEHQVTEISLDATEMGKPLYTALGFMTSDEHMTIQL